MADENKRIVCDLDDTICFSTNGEYCTSTPNSKLIEKLHCYKNNGFEISIFTSRNMRSYHNDVGKITAKMLPDAINWLNKENVPYDSIYIGKPWCGPHGFYIDDKAIRPVEFLTLSYEEILSLISNKKP